MENKEYAAAPDMRITPPVTDDLAPGDLHPPITPRKTPWQGQEPAVSSPESAPVTQSETAPATEPEKSAASRPAPPRKKKGWLWAVVAVMLLLLCATAAVCAPQLSHTVYRNTAVMGVDMGGMTTQEAADAWRAAEKAVYATELVLTEDGVEVKRCTLAEMGVHLPPNDAAAIAYAYGRDGSLLQNAERWVKSFFAPVDIHPAFDVDETVLRARVADMVENLNCTVVDGAFALTEEGPDGPGLYITKPADGVTLDGKDLEKQLTLRFQTGDLSPVECVYRQTKAETVDVAAIYRELHHKAEEAKCDKATGKPTRSYVGLDFDVDAVAEQLAAARPGETFLAKAEVAFPKVTTEMLEEAMFRDVLGTYTTKVTGSSARIHNVYLAAQCINGKIYNPGEEFWYNATVGERTVARGFGAAPAYVGGQTVDSVGGGICQVSSTLYYATLLANLKIVLRYCHQFAPAYITWGCDATVSWGGPDYAFRNNTDYPIKIVTDWKDNNLTTTILGTKTDDTYVKIISNTLSSTPWEEQTVVNPDLPYGSEPRVVQTPYTGYFVKTYRNVYDGEGNLISSTFEANSDYEKRDRIVEVPPDYYFAAPEETDPWA